MMVSYAGNRTTLFMDGTMARKTTSPLPSASEVLNRLAALGNPVVPKTVRFLEAPDAVRGEVLQTLQAQGTHVMQGLWDVDGVPKNTILDGVDRFELHKLVSEGAKKAPFTVVVDFDQWSPDPVEDLFQFLRWVAYGPEWNGLRIL